MILNSLGAVKNSSKFKSGYFRALGLYGGKLNKCPFMPHHSCDAVSSLKLSERMFHTEWRVGQFNCVSPVASFTP